MQLDGFSILVLMLIGFMVLFTTIIGIWYWKYGRKLVHEPET
jgi:hypothetical protein